MAKEQIFELMNNVLVFHLATVENGEPRVRGILEEVMDTDLKDEISNHPTRAFLKKLCENSPLEDFYNYKHERAKTRKREWRPQEAVSRLRPFVPSRSTYIVI